MLKMIDSNGLILEKEFYYISFNYFKKLIKKSVCYKAKSYQYNRLSTVKTVVTKDGNFFNRLLRSRESRDKLENSAVHADKKTEVSVENQNFLNNFLLYVKEYLKFIRFTFNVKGTDCLNQLKIIGMSREYCNQLSSLNWPGMLKKQLLKFNLLWNFNNSKTITKDKFFNFR